MVAGVQTVRIDEVAAGANLIGFDSGWGDGRYPVWIGRSASGEVACFVVSHCW